MADQIASSSDGISAAVSWWLTAPPSGKRDGGDDGNLRMVQSLTKEPDAGPGRRRS